MSELQESHLREEKDHETVEPHVLVNILKDMELPFSATSREPTADSSTFVNQHLPSSPYNLPTNSSSLAIFHSIHQTSNSMGSTVFLDPTNHTNERKISLKSQLFSNNTDTSITFPTKYSRNSFESSPISSIGFPSNHVTASSSQFHSFASNMNASSLDPLQAESPHAEQSFLKMVSSVIISLFPSLHHTPFIRMTNRLP